MSVLPTATVILALLTVALGGRHQAQPDEKYNIALGGPVSIPPSIRPRMRRRMPIAATLSAVVLAGAFYVILSEDYPWFDLRWAYGAIGLIFGYWLRGSAVARAE